LRPTEITPFGAEAPHISCLQGIDFEYALGQEESTIPTCIRYWGDHRRVCRPDPGTALSKAGATCLLNDGEFIQRVIHAWKGILIAVASSRGSSNAAAKNNRRANRFLLLLQATVRRAEPCMKPPDFGRFPCHDRYCAVSLISHNKLALIRAISSENALHTGYMSAEAMRRLRLLAIRADMLRSSYRPSAFRSMTSTAAPSQASSSAVAAPRGAVDSPLFLQSPCTVSFQSSRSHLRLRWCSIRLEQLDAALPRTIGGSWWGWWTLRCAARRRRAPGCRRPTCRGCPGPWPRTCRARAIWP
jgi:hypothetical protein